MGDDFSNHQIFVGDVEPQAFRRDFMKHLHNALQHQGYDAVQNPEAANRALAVGKTERWICLYDSAGSGDITDSTHFAPLSQALSKFASVVDIHMDDSCAVHFYLYENGEKMDRFGNSKSTWARWESDEERISFQRKPLLWQRFLQNARDEKLQRETWDDGEATTILDETARLFGWNEIYCKANLTIDYEGVPVFYREHFSDRQSPLSYGQYLQNFPAINFFEEFYFSNQ